MKVVNIINRFKSLPISSKRLLGLGMVVAIFVALPISIWAIVTQTFNISKKAGGTTVPLIINETFDGDNIPLDPTKWNYSGVGVNQPFIIHNHLMMGIPQGSINVGDHLEGSDYVTQALVDSHIPQIIGPFDVSVDVNFNIVAGNSAWAGLKFAPGIILRRYRSQDADFVQLLSTHDGVTYAIRANALLPQNTGVVRLRLIRTQTEINVSYNPGGGDTFLGSLSDQGYLDATDTLPRLVLQNDAPGYPEAVAIFDNYSASATMIVETATPSPPPIISPTPTARPPAGECEMCAGIAGIGCGAGLTCQMTGQVHPDQSGICVKTDGTSICPISPTPTPTPTCEYMPVCLYDNPPCNATEPPNGWCVPTPTPYILKVQDPNGGETLNIGQTHTIKWQGPARNSYLIYLVNSLGEQSLINAASSSASFYDWQVNTPFVNGGNIYKIKVVEATTQGALSDESDNFFNINSSSSPTPTPKPGDVNADGLVNIVDIGIIIDNYRMDPPQNPAADLNHDGVVNIIDIGIVVDNYQT